MAVAPRRKSKLTGHPAERPSDEEVTSSPSSEMTPPAGLVSVPAPTAGADREVEDTIEEVAESTPKPPVATTASPRPRRGRSSGSSPLVTRNPRRRPVVDVSDEDMVSFNCKMSRGLRRRVKILAANSEVDIQDVVAAALEDYLAVHTGPDAR